MKNSAVPMEIDPEDLASLGLKENFEAFLKQNVKEHMEFGMNIPEENLKLIKKMGLNIDDLKSGIKPTYKDLNEEEMAELFYRENEGKFSFTKKIPKSFKELVTAVEADRIKLTEAMNNSKDERLLSSDEEIADPEEHQKATDLKEAKKIIEDLENMDVEENVSNDEDYKERPPKDENEEYEDSNLEEKRQFNKEVHEFYDQMMKDPNNQMKAFMDFKSKAERENYTDAQIKSAFKEMIEMDEVDEEASISMKQDFEMLKEEFSKKNRKKVKVEKVLNESFSKKKK